MLSSSQFYHHFKLVCHGVSHLPPMIQKLCVFERKCYQLKYNSFWFTKKIYEWQIKNKDICRSKTREYASNSKSIMITLYLVNEQWCSHCHVNSLWSDLKRLITEILGKKLKGRRELFDDGLKKDEGSKRSIRDLYGSFFTHSSAFKTKRGNIAQDAASLNNMRALSRVATHRK